ncbi:MAG TPA: hypothetical protein VGT98_08390, partial [Candidatus Elarobacter sp.]|nr:hypothetical protein [Candidatus Elarobacter sp.]
MGTLHRWTCTWIGLGTVVFAACAKTDQKAMDTSAMAPAAGAPAAGAPAAAPAAATPVSLA